MPNRYIREGILTSEAVASLSWPEEVFYRRLLSKVDDFGRFTAHPSLLRAALYPLQLAAVRDADIPRWIAACEKAGLVYAYHAEGKPVLVVNKWEKGRSTRSSYPEPPPELLSKMEGKEYIASGGKFSGSDGGTGHLEDIRSQVGSMRSLNTSDPDSDSDPDTGKERVSASIHPSADAVVAHGKTLVPPADDGFCRSWWSEMEGTGWIDRQGRVIHPTRWKHSLAAAWGGAQHGARERAARSGGRPTAPRTKPAADESW